MPEEKSPSKPEPKGSKPVTREPKSVQGSGYPGGRVLDAIEKKGGYGGSAPKVIPTRPEGPAASVNPSQGTQPTAQAPASSPSASSDSGGSSASSKD